MSETSTKKMIYDFEQERFTPKDKNFLRYINDSSHDIHEFREFVIYHRDGFMAIINQFKYFQTIKTTPQESSNIMEERIKELTETCVMLNWVLADIKEKYSKFFHNKKEQ